MINLPAGDPRNKIEYLASLIGKLGNTPINLLCNVMFRFMQREPDARAMIFPAVGNSGHNLIATLSPMPISMTTFDRWEFYVTSPSQSAMVRQLPDNVAQIKLLTDEFDSVKVWQFCQTLPFEAAVVNQPMSLAIDVRNIANSGGAYRLYVETFDKTRKAYRAFEREVLPSANWKTELAQFQLSDPKDSTKPYRGMLRYGIEMLHVNNGQHAGDELDIRHPFMCVGDVETLPLYNAVSDFANISAVTRSVFGARISGVIGVGGEIKTQTIDSGLLDALGLTTSNYFRSAHPNLVIEFQDITGNDINLSIRGNEATVVAAGGSVKKVDGTDITKITVETMRNGIGFELTAPALAAKAGQAVLIEVDYHIDTEFKSAGFTLEN
ncbi:hypothetical protein [Agarivorans sp. DSG3-1]|uniref:hypothetical protein n=1 Tax=Agarivorans sp. DSG3-1 TaxID=3342249 RepID=UPI00398EF106